MFTHGSISFVIKNRSTGQTENLRRKHNWVINEKIGYEKSKQREANRFKREWNADPGRYDDVISVKVN